jgi:arginine repressor
MRLVLFAGVAVFAACTAPADTLKDASVQVKPGRYNWVQETTVIGFINKKEENLECLIPQKATVTLSKLARDLDESCTVDKVSPAAGGYNFRLNCKGDIPIKADATLTHTHTSLKIKANGSATVLGIIPASVSAKAEATYMGDCTPDEVAKEIARWNEENP